MMKRIFSMAMAALLAVTAWAAPKDQKQADNQGRRQYQVFGVGFYNLENLFDTINNNGSYDLEFSPAGARQWHGKKYWSKIENLARCIAEMSTPTTPNGPAFLGVSEIENRSVLVDLVKAVDNRLRAQGKKPWNLQIVHHDSPDKRGVDVAALYNPRQFRLHSVNHHTLQLGEMQRPTRDQTVVTGIMGGDTVSIIVNHWPSRLGGQERSSWLREGAAALSKHIADSLWQTRPSEGVIIMGDLNDDPQDKSCAQVLGAVKNPAGVKPHAFYNPFWSLLDKGIGTLAYRGSWNLFDQIIVSGTLLKDNSGADGLHYQKAQVNNFQFLRNEDGSPHRTFSAGVFLNGYSDHFPTEHFLVKAR